MSLARVVSGLAAFSALAAASPVPVPKYFRPKQFSRRDLTPELVIRELAPELSANAVVVGPQDATWANVTERWNTLEVPVIEVAIQVGEESDIATIVQYANENSIDFFTVNQGHAVSVESTKHFRGLQIDVKLLNKLEIQPGNKTAILGAGVYNIQVMQGLWDQGYYAATGGNNCPGVTGVTLGGGHGRLEGQFGLSSDTVVAFNVVLADGTETRVDAETHPDLFWAMKGAGHNFAIVKSTEVTIHPVEVETWHYHRYIWSGDKLEEAFDKLVAFHDNGNTPVKMGLSYGMFRFDATYGDGKPIIFWSFAYEGPAEEAEELLAPFNEIENLFEDSNDVPYPSLSAAQETSVECVPSAKMWKNALLKTYNTTMERQVYDMFVENSAKYPELQGVAVGYEGYATKGVEDIPDETSSYPHRHEHHLNFFTAVIPEDSENFDQLVSDAAGWGQAILDIWNADREPAHYVNYNLGDEPLEQTYGASLPRLRELKTIYDPNNRFRYYVPINPINGTNIASR